MFVKSLSRRLKSGYERFSFITKRYDPGEDAEDTEGEGAEDAEDAEGSEDEEESEDESFVNVEEPFRPPAYPYRELGEAEVRLLRIVPGTGAIECHLHQMPLAEVRFFYALSYVWGDASEKGIIMLEGQPFEVTWNLFTALHQFRQRPGDPKRQRLDIGYPEDYFWIDAICINQGDLDERSRQVARMMEIYHAGHVIIWLGPVRTRRKPDSRLRRLTRRTQRIQWSKSDLLLDGAIETLFKKAQSMWFDWEPVDEDDNVDLKVKLGDDYKDIITATENILQRPWFERVWTIQEACLDTCPTIYIGRYSVHLDRLTKFWKILLVENNFLVTYPGSFRMTSLEQINRLYKSALFDWDDNPKKMGTAKLLATILRLTSRKESSEPRDQIYGILGLLLYLGGQDLPEDLKPDYRLPYENICWGYAAFMFESAGDLKLLDCTHNEHRNVPSWVPDFRYLSVSFDVESQSSAHVSSDKKTLRLQGCLLGTFRSFINGYSLTKHLPTKKKIPVKLSNRFKAFDKYILKPSATIRGITIEEAFNDMMEDTIRIIPKRGGKHPESFYHVYRHLRDSRWARVSRSARKRRTPTVRRKEQIIADQLAAPFLLLADGTITSVTRRDAQITSGDLICIFKGAKKLSLLRPSGDGYTFLGQCTVEVGPLTQQEFGDDFWSRRNAQEFKLI